MKVKAQEALKAYTDAVREMAILEDEHEELFRAHALLASRMVEKLQQLRESVREADVKVENRYFTAEPRHRSERWYDAETLLDLFPEAVSLPGLVRTSIDRDVADELSKQGVISRSVSQSAERVTPGATAVYVSQRCPIRGRKLAKEGIPALTEV
jgi:hypothetical protein